MQKENLQDIRWIPLQVSISEFLKLDKWWFENCCLAAYECIQEIQFQSRFTTNITASCNYQSNIFKGSSLYLLIRSIFLLDHKSFVIVRGKENEHTTSSEHEVQTRFLKTSMLLHQELHESSLSSMTFEKEGQPRNVYDLRKWGTQEMPTLGQYWDHTSLSCSRLKLL